MATRNTPFAPGTPCWVDLMSSDKARSIEFYSALMGWTAEEAGPDLGNYVNFSKDGHKVAGMVANTTGDAPDGWNTYISTADIQASTTAAVEAGATELVPAMQVADLGWMAVLTDTAGGTFGLWQPGTHTGFQRYSEPGSVIWNEYQSKDFGASSGFYSKLFGWDMKMLSDTDDFRYATGEIDGEGSLGMMDAQLYMPAEVPSQWTVYFNVADTEAACVRAVELGGTVLRGPEDSPFGKIAELSDPTGAWFKLNTEPAG